MTLARSEVREIIRRVLLRDLREYVIDDIYYGYSIKECCERYDISRSEVREIIRRDQEGNY